MKVAWVTPFSDRSAIGEFSKHITDELARACDVEVWVSDEGKTRATDLPVVKLAQQNLSDLATHDVVVYNFGNHVGYHRRVYEVSRRRPGVAILHDRVYQHMLGAYWLNFGPGPSHYVERMESFYGQPGRQAAEDAIAGRRPHVWEIDEDAVQFPLFEENIVGAEGVVVHAHDHAALVSERWLGPVHALFLPTYPTDDLSAAQRQPAASERLVLLTVGDVNRNKHIHTVIEVLGRNRDLAQLYEYRAIGHVEENLPYTRELRALIDEYGLKGQVSLLGYVTDDALARHVKEADVFVNLRHPCWESGSASLARQLAAGKPIVVYDSGGFQDPPAASVARIPPGDAARLAEVLRALGSDGAARLAFGEGARRLARERTVQRYASELLGFFHQVRCWRPLVRLCDRVGSSVAPLGDANTPGLVKRSSSEIARLFPEMGTRTRST